MSTPPPPPHPLPVTETRYAIGCGVLVCLRRQKWSPQRLYPVTCLYLHRGAGLSVRPILLYALVFRVIVGFGFGGSLPVTTVLMSEFLPTKYRAAVLCRLSGMFWAAGLIITSLLGLVLSRILGPG